MKYTTHSYLIQELFNHQTIIYEAGMYLLSTSGTLSQPGADPQDFSKVVAKILQKIVAHSFVCILSRIICCIHIRVPIVMGKSTEDILQLAVDHIVTLLDKGSVVCAAFIDLRKVFDSHDHYLLLQRIFKLGIHNKVLE